MDDDEPKPMTDGDATPSPADAPAEPSLPLKDTNAAPGPDIGNPEANPSVQVPATVAEAGEQAKQSSAKLSQQASDKALAFADQGKERATGALEQLSQMLNDAAGQVDERLGDQYGHYARNAAGTVQGLADQLREKKVDDLIADARTLVRKSPGVALGGAAAVGFVLARLVSAGLDQRDA